MMGYVYVVRLTLHTENYSRQRGWKMVGKKIVHRYQMSQCTLHVENQMAPYSWVVSMFQCLF